MRSKLTAFALGVLAGILSAYYALARTQAVAIRETVSAWMADGVTQAATVDVPQAPRNAQQFEEELAADRRRSLGEAPPGMEGMWAELIERGGIKGGTQ